MEQIFSQNENKNYYKIIKNKLGKTSNIHNHMGGQALHILKYAL